MDKTWYSIKAQDESGEAEVLIYDEIGFFGISAEAFVRDLQALGRVERLTVRINSPGGNVFDSVTIYNALRRQAGEVTVRIDGVAASAASFIAMAGDPVIMPENTMLMIHDPFGIAVGSAEDMRAMAGALERITDSIVSMYRAKSEQSPDAIAEMMAAETWMTAAEAVEMGFADELVPTVEIANAFDLSRFKHPPQDLGAPTIRAAPGDRWMTAREIRAEMALGGAFAKTIGRAPAAAPDATPDPAATATEGAPMDLKNLTLEDLRAQRPDLVEDVSESAAGEAAEEQRQAGAEAERERIAGIEAVALPGHEALVEKLKNDGTPVADAAVQIALAEKGRGAAHIEAQRAAEHGSTGERLPAPAQSIQMPYSAEDPAKRRERVANALAFRQLGGTPDDSFREFVNMTAVDLAREFLPGAGRGLTPTQVIENALTTSDFPFTLGAGADKVLLQRYGEYPATYMSVASSMTLNDFKQKTLIRFGDFPELKEVMEDGEYTYGAPGESPEYIKLRTFGRLLSLSRQALVNDDLGAFLRMSGMIGEAVRRFENKLVWSVVTTNANMGDGNPLFDASHGNLAGTGGAPSAGTIGDGKKAMRKQNSVDGESINLQPATIAVPSDLETAVEQLLSALIVPQTPDQLTPASQRTLNRVVEPLLDSNSTTAWYLVAELSREAGLVYANLTGVAGPEVFVDDHFTRDGMTVKVRRDFASAAQDYRGLYKNAGA